MEEWLENICNILRETDVPQIYGDLIRFESTYDEETDSFKQEVMKGKCALGVISCEVGMTLNYDVQTYDYSDILNYANVPSELLRGLPYIHVSTKYVNDESKDDLHGEKRVPTNAQFDFDSSASGFAEYIFKVNDGGLTFKELADYLEETFGDFNTIEQEEEAIHA